MPSAFLRSVAYCLQLGDRITLLKTCRRIRADLTSDPRLWTSVRGGILPLRLSLSHQVLQLSEPLPVRLHMTATTVAFEREHRIGMLLQSHLHRLRVLDLGLRDRPHSGSGPPLDVAWAWLRDILSQPTPQLEILKLVVSSSSRIRNPEPQRLPVDFLGGPDGARSLRRLNLRGLRLIPGETYPVLTNLVSFHYSTLDVTLREEDLWTLLDQLGPQLRYLGLEARQFSWESEEPEPTMTGVDDIPLLEPREMRAAPALNQVWLQGFTSGGLTPLLRVFRNAHTLEAAVSIDQAVSRDSADGVWPEERVHLALFSSDRYSGESLCRFVPPKHWYPSDDDSPVITLRWGYIPNGTTLERVTRLSTTEAHWCRSTTVEFSLPNLAELVITLSSCVDRHVMSGDLWTSAQAFVAPPVLPKLRRLYLVHVEVSNNARARRNSCTPPAGYVAPPCRRPGVRETVIGRPALRPTACPRWGTYRLALSDVAQFAGDLLKTSSHQLDLIGLVGITHLVDENLEAGYRAVQRVAARLELTGAEDDASSGIIEEARAFGHYYLLEDGFPGPEESLDDFRVLLR